MDYKKLTVYFILSVIVLIGVYDIYVIYTAGTEASISNTMIVWAYKYPSFPFLMGFVMGHLFWRMRENKDTAEVTKNLK